MSKIFIYDAATNEELLRDMTAEEQAEFNKIVKDTKQKEDAKIIAKSALLSRLGITEEEAKLLLS
jgi:hypothetical protein